MGLWAPAGSPIKRRALSVRGAADDHGAASAIPAVSHPRSTAQMAKA